MARIRTIKPDFWTDERLTECSMSARLMFIGLLNFADDAGNLVRSARKIKMQIFPADVVDCEPLIQELITQGVLIEYSVNGVKYLNIKGFLKHQVISRPSASSIPRMEITDCSDTTHGGLTESSLNAQGGKGMEGNGRERNSSSLSITEPVVQKSDSDDDGVLEIPEPGQPERGDPWFDGLAPPDPVTWASVFGDAFGVAVSTALPHEWAKFAPLAVAWCAAGVTVGQMRAAVSRAHADAGEPIAYLPAYADRVLASMVPRQARALAVVPAHDPDSRSAIEAEGVANGAGPWNELREHWPQYVRRVRGAPPASAFPASLTAIVTKGLTA